MKKLLLAFALLSLTAYADDATVPSPDPTAESPAPSLGKPADMTPETPPTTSAPGDTATAAASSSAAPAVNTAPPPIANPTPKAESKVSDDTPSTHDMLRERLDREAKEEQANDLDRKRELVRHEAATQHLGIDYVMHGFPNYNYGTSSTPIYRSAKGASLEWLFFPINHGIVRFGLGVAASAYFVKSDLQLAGMSPIFWAGGPKATLELTPIIGQFLVPFAVAGLDFVKQKEFVNNANTHVDSGSGNPTEGTTTPATSFNTPYYGIGLAINLNPLERKAAAEGLVTTGVRKFLLAYTFEHHASSDPSHAGDSHFLGLRFEY